MNYEPVALTPAEPYTPRLSDAAIAAGIRLAPPGSPTTLDYSDWKSAEQTPAHTTGKLLIPKLAADLRELLSQLLLAHVERVLKLAHPLLQLINTVGQNAVQGIHMLGDLLVSGWRHHTSPSVVTGVSTVGEATPVGVEHSPAPPAGKRGITTRLVAAFKPRPSRPTPTDPSRITHRAAQL